MRGDWQREKGKKKDFEIRESNERTKRNENVSNVDMKGIQGLLNRTETDERGGWHRHK